MKEVCGFLDKRNRFHRTEAEANKANIEYEESLIASEIYQIVKYHSLNDYDTREQLRSLVNQLSVLPEPSSISRAIKRFL